MTMNVIFAKTRHNYESYQDFWQLVNLSGFRSQYIDEIDWQQDVTVIGTPHNGEWFGIPARKRARLIHWNLERCIPDVSYGDPAYAGSYPYIDETWASDRAMSYHIGAKYVFLGGHRAMGSVDVGERHFDVISLMYWNGRRYNLLGQLSGLSRADTNGGLWGEARHAAMTHSRLMITCHQDDYPWCEPLRLMVAGTFALPILSETCLDAGYWNGRFEQDDLSNLGAKARFLLQDEVRLARMGAAAWRLVCVEHPFAKEVEAAL